MDLTRATTGGGAGAGSGGPPPPAAPGAPGRAISGPAPEVAGASNSPTDQRLALRELPVTRGQTLQATVVAIADGGVWLGWRGSIFAARTALQLQPGLNYEFTVSAIDPQVVLSAARQLASPAMPPASGGGWGGGGGGRVRGGAWVGGGGGAGAPRPGVAAGRAEVGPGGDLPDAMHGLMTKAPSGQSLLAFDRALGHDQEVRLLRLLGLPADRLAHLAGQLRSTGKAQALALLDAELPPTADHQGARRAARAFVEGLSGIERDNARRSELGAPLWLPLPANPGAGLRDARMYLRTEQQAAGSSAGSERPFTVVLLLDLSQLGELRVDVELRGQRVDVLFQPLQESTLAVLLHARDDLRQLLGRVGLEVDRLVVRQAPGRTLPIGDLLLPPRDGQALVDIHA